MSTSVSLDFDVSELSASLAGLDARVRGAMVVAAGTTARRAEAHMRTHAPWTDQTGNARNGLIGRARHTATSSSVVLSHSVDYGIWLETRWSGKYAIIWPTIERFGPQYVALVSKLAFGRR